jgi:HD-like signal output (HDOD) protein
MENRIMRILFVDDEISVISMLKKMVKSLSNDWYVQYAIGGVEALEFLDTESFDIVVTDLNMPEINGVKLLKYIQKYHSHIVRIVFSSSLTRESIKSIAPFTHRFIAKPCGVKKLAQAIENSLFIYRELDNKKIQKVLAKTGTIPSLPRIYRELMDKIDDEEFSLKEAASLISSDVGMSANIMKQINLLGEGEAIHGIEQAVMLLGLDSIKAIALSTHIFNSMDSVKIPYFTVEKLIRHSMLTAVFAKEITKIELDDQDQADSAFIAGILHDLGAILFVNNFPKKYSDVRNRVHEAERPIADVERNLIGISHGEIGAHLLALWGFPTTILGAVAFHEDPIKRLNDSFSLLTAVFVGSYLADYLDNSDRKYGADYLEKSPYIHELSCVGRLEFWKKRCCEIYETL